MSKQKINDIMKIHKPWAVGLATRPNQKMLFYPVIKSSKENRWYGYTTYKYKDLPLQYIFTWRDGSSKKWMIIKNDAVYNPFSMEKIILFLFKIKRQLKLRGKII